MLTLPLDVRVARLINGHPRGQRDVVSTRRHDRTLALFGIQLAIYRSTEVSTRVVEPGSTQRVSVR